MEELHRIHKDVPFGYWVLWVEPALRKLAAWLKAPKVSRGPYDHLITLR